MLSQKDIQSIQSIIGYNFKSEQLLQTAFTHSSYAFSKKIESNERLEFLGDSVLNFCTTMFLYDNFDLSEGQSSKTRAYLVSSENVSKYISTNKLQSYLLCDNFNPEKSVNVMGDLYEAIVGAMLKDSNLETCKKFIYSSLNYSTELIKEVMSKTKDYKTELQEIVQKTENSKLEYILLSKSGPAHMPEFVVEVQIDGKSYGKAMAHNKKEAENISAKLTIEQLNKK